MKRITFKFNFILFALVAWSMAMVSCGGSNDDVLGEDETSTDNEITLLAPSSLKHEWRKEGYVLSWKAVSKASSYKISIEGVLDTVSNGSYCLIANRLGYDATYSWKVQAVRGSVLSDWSPVATLKTPPIPAFMKYVGSWQTDSLKMVANMGDSPLPVDGLLPDASNANGIDIVIVENDTVENGLLLSISGLDGYIPVGSEGLNSIPMAASIETGTISGTVTVNQPIERVLDPPLKLDDIEITLPSEVKPLLEGATINTIVLKINTVTVSGKLENTEGNKASYVIIAEGTLTVTTNKGAFVDMILNSQLKAIGVQLNVFSTKRE